MFYLATPAKLLERAYFFKQSENDDCEDQGEPGKAPPPVPSVEGAGPSPGHGHGRRLRAGLWRLGAGFPVLPAQGGAWGPTRLLPVKRSWHFRARQRRWLPALEVSIWPLS